MLKQPIPVRNKAHGGGQPHTAEASRAKPHFCRCRSASETSDPMRLVTSRYGALRSRCGLVAVSLRSRCGALPFAPRDCACLPAGPHTRVSERSRCRWVLPTTLASTDSWLRASRSMTRTRPRDHRGGRSRDSRAHACPRTALLVGLFLRVFGHLRTVAICVFVELSRWYCHSLEDPRCRRCKLCDP